MDWIYINNKDNTARFVLGEFSDKSAATLICFGINPSTAEPNALDRTLEKVKRLAGHNGYVNWIMLNIYPQRATNPANLHGMLDEDLCKQNLDAIRSIFHDFPNSNILFAFGNLILKRPYLQSCFEQIKTIVNNDFVGKTYCIKLTKCGFPVHPLYQKNDSIFTEYHL